MKKKNLTALMAALALTVVASSSLLCGNGIVSYEDDVQAFGIPQSRMGINTTALLHTKFGKETCTGPT